MAKRSFKVLTLNNISIKGLRRFPRDDYEVASGISEPDAIILRSYNMHLMGIPDSVVAIGRAGAGVNNIPIEALSRREVSDTSAGQHLAPGRSAHAGTPDPSDVETTTTPVGHCRRRGHPAVAAQVAERQAPRRRAHERQRRAHQRVDSSADAEDLNHRA